MAGTYPFGASLLYKVNASTTARMNGRLVLNGSTEIKGGKGESPRPRALATTLTLGPWPRWRRATPSSCRDIPRGDGYFAADHTTFWGCKIG